jgi:hypothetical protein
MPKALALLLFASVAPSLQAENPSPDQIRASASRAVAITQQGSAGFYKIYGVFFLPRPRPSCAGVADGSTARGAG